MYVGTNASVWSPYSLQLSLKMQSNWKSLKKFNIADNTKRSRLQLKEILNNFDSLLTSMYLYFLPYATTFTHVYRRKYSWAVSFVKHLSISSETRCSTSIIERSLPSCIYMYLTTVPTRQAQISLSFVIQRNQYLHGPVYQQVPLDKKKRVDTGAVVTWSNLM